MSKTFNTYQKAAIKNAAKAVARYNATKDKINEQIAKLEAQKQELKVQEQEERKNKRKQKNQDELLEKL